MVIHRSLPSKLRDVATTRLRDFAHKLLLLLAAGLFAAVAAPCAASSSRGEVFLDKENITLGDVFDVTGDQAAKVITSAPEPGRKTVYDVSALAQIAHAYDVDWKQKSNYERVTVTRTAQTITPAMIHDKIVEALAAVATDKDLDVALDNQNLQVDRPTSMVLDTQIVDLKYDPIRHRFTGSLVVNEKGKDASLAEVVPVTGRAMPMVQVGMLVHAMAPGDTFGAADVEWVRVALDKAGADAVTSPKQLEGSELHRAMTSQAVIRTRDLVKERLITKGSLVMMNVNLPGIFLTAQGRALGDGAIGDTIRVTNTQSNRTIDAVVTGKDKVSVMPATATNVAAR